MSERPVHFQDPNTFLPACRADSLEKSGYVSEVTCATCRRIMEADAVICSIKEEGRPALEREIEVAARSGEWKRLPDGHSVAANPLYIRVGNVEIVGTGKEVGPTGLPFNFRVMVNGKPIRCRHISIEGGIVGDGIDGGIGTTWKVLLDFLPAEEKGGA
jgi:hypothetical protein